MAQHRKILCLAMAFCFNLSGCNDSERTESVRLESTIIISRYREGDVAYNLDNGEVYSADYSRNVDRYIESLRPKNDNNYCLYNVYDFILQGNFRQASGGVEYFVVNATRVANSHNSSVIVRQFYEATGLSPGQICYEATVGTTVTGALSPN